jgi:hypothetical protein
MNEAIQHPFQTAYSLGVLHEFARKYIWWKTPEEALEFPTRIVAQTMDRGSLSDVSTLVETFGEKYLQEILRNAEAGQFNARSWHFWHYRLGLASARQVPALPQRLIP